MRRLIAVVATASVSLLVGGVLGAIMVRKSCDRHLGHVYVTELINKAYSAREIYRGHAFELANRTREGLPAQVLAMEKEFGHDEYRDTALRVVQDVYQASKMVVPGAIRPILAAVPPRSSLPMNQKGASN
jgi:hypothetical protein